MLDSRNRRVVVTGLGLVSPLGCELESAWKKLLAGQSGVRRIEAMDVGDWPVQIAGLVDGFEPLDYVSAKEAKRLDGFTIYGMAAARQAVADSGLQVDEENERRCGVAVGSGIGGLTTIEANYLRFHKGGVRRISPMLIPASIINIVAGQISIMLNFKGVNLSLVSACATGAFNIAAAAHAIARGDADAMLAGGAESVICPLGIGGFTSAQALTSTHNDEPEKASRPWDAKRDGFVVGEGAGVLMLEDYECAKKRGANMYCEVSGVGYSSDAHHVTQPDPTGEGASVCMSQALNDAEIAPERVGYINAHGTSTPAGDLAETVAVKRTFGAHASALALSSCKSMIGHLLGAASSVEAVFAILSLRDNVMPPTINLENPDPECDLDYVPEGAREKNLDYVLSNSFGFGGANNSLIFGRV